MSFTERYFIFVGYCIKIMYYMYDVCKLLIYNGIYWLGDTKYNLFSF